VIEFLKLEKLDVDARDKNNMTPLCLAAEKGFQSIVKLLLETNVVNANIKDTHYGASPLFWAAENGHESVVKLFLETVGTDVNATENRYGLTPLSCALHGWDIRE